MSFSENHYIKFLVDEIMRSTFSSVSDALAEVRRFQNTERFHTSYENWKKLQYEKSIKHPKPFHVSKLFFR